MVFNVWQAMSHSVFIHLVLKFKFCPERRKIIVSVKFSLKNPKIYKECMSSLKFCYQFFVYLNAYLALPDKARTNAIKNTTGTFASII